MSRAGVLSTFAMLAAFATSCSQDPPLAVAPNVDLSRFQGQWFEIAKLPRTTQTDCYGTLAFYTLSSDGTLVLVNQCHVGSISGPLKSVTMTAKATDPATPAKLSLDVGGFYGDYWILEVGTDYEYAVVGHPSRSYLWILSRTPSIDQTKLQSILSNVRAAQFDTSRLEYTPQSQ